MMFRGISLLKYLRISRRGCDKSSCTLYGLSFCLSTLPFWRISTFLLCLESRTMIGLDFDDLLPTRCERLISSGLRSTPNSSLTKFVARISVSSRGSAFFTLLSGMPYIRILVLRVYCSRSSNWQVRASFKFFNSASFVSIFLHCSRSNFRLSETDSQNFEEVMNLLTAGSISSCNFSCMMAGRRSSIHLLSFASIFSQKRNFKKRKNNNVTKNLH